MQINVYLELAVVMLLHNSLFYCPNSWLPIRRRINIVSIEVLPQRVRTEIPSVHPVRIEHRHHLKDELLSKHLPLLTVLRQYIPYAV